MTWHTKESEGEGRTCKGTETAKAKTIAMQERKGHTMTLNDKVREWKETQGAGHAKERAGKARQGHGMNVNYGTMQLVRA